MGSGSLTQGAQQEMSPRHGRWLCAAPALLWLQICDEERELGGNVRCSECPEEKTPVRWKVVLSRDIMALVT